MKSKLVQCAECHQSHIDFNHESLRMQQSFTFALMDGECLHCKKKVTVKMFLQSTATTFRFMPYTT